MDLHGNEVLNLGSFTLLPQHVVRLILARELKADEVTKFQVRPLTDCQTFDNAETKPFRRTFICMSGRLSHNAIIIINGSTIRQV